MKKSSVLLTLAVAPTFLYASQTSQDLSSANEPGHVRILKRGEELPQQKIEKLEGAVLAYKGMLEWERQNHQKSLLSLQRELEQRTLSEEEMYETAHRILEDNNNLKKLLRDMEGALKGSQFDLDSVRKELDQERSLHSHTCTELAGARRQIEILKSLAVDPTFVGRLQAQVRALQQREEALNAERQTFVSAWQAQIQDFDVHERALQAEVQDYKMRWEGLRRL